MFQATKMFASNFDSMRAETFFIEVWDLPNTVFVASSQIRLEEEQKAELPLFWSSQKGYLQDQCLVPSLCPAAMPGKWSVIKRNTNCLDTSETAVHPASEFCSGNAQADANNILATSDPLPQGTHRKEVQVAKKGCRWACWLLSQILELPIWVNDCMAAGFPVILFSVWQQSGRNDEG